MVCLLVESGCGRLLGRCRGSRLARRDEGESAREAGENAVPEGDVEEAQRA
jgi:hypothetical protein